MKTNEYKLKENATPSHESAEDWYGSYGAHISTDRCGDVCVQAVDYRWLDTDADVDTFRHDKLAEIDVPSIGDFAHCDDLPAVDLRDAVRRGDEEDLQAMIDYLRADDYPDDGLRAMGLEIAAEIEAAKDQVAEINRLAERADSYAAAMLKDASPRMTWDEVEQLVKVAQRVRDDAESVVGELERAVECYLAGDLDGTVEALDSAGHAENEHGDDPATSGLRKQLLEENESADRGE